MSPLFSRQEANNVLAVKSEPVPRPKSKSFQALMANEHQELFLKSVGGLHQDKRYSDMTIICQNTRFETHKAIVLTQSAPLAKALNSDFQEGQNRTINMPDIADPDNTSRMISYMYKQDYTVDSTNRPSDVEIKSNTDILRIHMSVHAIADYWDIKGLKNLAAVKFSEALRQAQAAEESFDLSEIVSELFDKPKAATEKLRPIIVAVAAARFKELREDLAKIMVEGEALSEFGLDIVSRLAEEPDGLRRRVRELDWELESFKRDVRQAYS